MKQGALMAVVAVVTLVILSFWWWGGADQAGGQRMAQAVNVVAPRAAVLVRQVEAVGSARARQAVSLTSQVDGRVESIAMREGSRVKKGDLLLALDDRAAAADLARAEAARVEAETAWQRAHRLQDTRAISEAEVDRLKAALLAAEAEKRAAEARLSYHQIRAPFSGVVGLRRVDVGTYLRAGDLIATIDDVDQLEVEFTVPERWLGSLDVNQKLIATSDSWPGREFTGHVTQLDSRIDPLTRAITVRGLLDNRDGLLRPGQFLHVSLSVGETPALMIPEQAILTQGAVSFAFVADGDKAQRRELRLGLRQQGWVEVLAGINANDQVIITGHNRLGGGSPIRVLEDDNALLPETAGAFLAGEQ